MASILARTSDSLAELRGGELGQLNEGDDSNLAQLHLAAFLSRCMTNGIGARLNNDVLSTAKTLDKEVNEIFNIPLFVEREPFVDAVNAFLKQMADPQFPASVFDWTQALLAGSPSADGEIIEIAAPIGGDATQDQINALVKEAVEGNYADRQAAIKNLVDLAQGGNRGAMTGIIKVFTEASKIQRGGADFISKRLADEGALSGDLTTVLTNTIKSPTAPEFAAFWAITTLNRIGEASGPYIDALRAAADKATTPRVRGEAVRALGIIQNIDALPTLEKALKDKSADVRDQAASAVGNILVSVLDDEARTRLQTAVRGMLKDTSPIVRASAAESLVVAFQVEDAAELVKTLAKDNAPEARIMAARLAGSIPDADAAFAVISELIDDKQWQVRVAVVMAAQAQASVDLRFTQIVQGHISKTKDPDARVQAEVEVMLEGFNIKPDHTQAVAKLGLSTESKIKITEDIPLGGNTVAIIDTSGSMTGEKSKIVVEGKLRLIGDLTRDLFVGLAAQMAKQGVTLNVAMSDTRAIEEETPKIKLGGQDVGGFFGTGLVKADPGNISKMSTFVGKVIAAREKRVARGPMWTHMAIALQMANVQNIVVFSDGTPSDGLFVNEDTFNRAFRELNRFRMIKVSWVLTDDSKRISGAITEQSGGKLVSLER